MKPAPAQPFQYIQESDDPFLTLWPHRYDYIWAPHPNAGDKPDWQTESRHALSDRLIQQGAYLYGVRFGSTTSYAMLDIDIASLYHPRRDSYAIYRILAALEPLGLVASLACTSSYSAGLHLYFPFSEALNAWEIALAITTLLENAGLKVAPGQLEVFPNAKAYVSQGNPTLYAAHRLPIQAGSYLLDNNWQPIWSDQATFATRWQLVQAKNDITPQQLKRILKQCRRKGHRISTKADKFLNDLNTEIEAGWTGPGQTNRLLGRIAMRSYVFAHILYATAALEGQALVDDIVSIAKALPGFTEFCRHQHDLEQEAENWARCIENSHYFHYGDPQGKYKAHQEKPVDEETTQTSLNELRRLDARERIRAALADLLEKGTLPAETKARTKSLTGYHISPSTLYKHKDLWHPEHLWKTPPDPHAPTADSEPDQKSGSEIHPSLLGAIACNCPTDNGSSDSETYQQLEIGCNLPAGNGPGASATGSALIQQVLHQVKTRRQREQLQRCQQQDPVQLDLGYQPSPAQVERMRRYWRSGDPILMGEAIAWSRIYPGRLGEQ